MNIQIFGVKKCFDTQKAERYFKERKIPYQYVDLRKKGLSQGELASVERAVGIDNLINIQCPAYTRLNLNRIGSKSVRLEILLNHPELYITPIVRNGKSATAGFQPDIWNSWK